jgi:hypothetical protein
MRMNVSKRGVDGRARQHGVVAEHDDRANRPGVVIAREKYRNTGFRHCCEKTPAAAFRPACAILVRAGVRLSDDSIEKKGGEMPFTPLHAARIPNVL